MMNKRLVFVFLTCITLLGAWLRLYQLNYESLSLDELMVMNLTDPELDILTIINISRMHGGQTLNMLLYSLFSLFSYTSDVGRYTCAIVGIVSIPAFYLLMREFSSQKVSLIGALLVAINYWHITYSQEVNYHSLVFLFSILSYLFFVRSIKDSGTSSFYGYAFSTVALINIHSYGFLLFICQLITFAIIFFVYKPKATVLQGFVLSAIAILLFTPWNDFLLNELWVGYSWAERPKFYFGLAYFNNYFGKDIISTVFAGLFILLFLKWAIESRKVATHGQMNLIVLAWIFLSLLLPFIKSMIGNSILNIQYTFITIPALIIAICIGLENFERTTIKITMMGVLVLSSLITLFIIKDYYRVVNKPQLREASEFVVTKNTQNNYPIFTDNAWQINFYFKNTFSRVIEDDSLIHVPNAKKVWLFSSSDQIENSVADNFVLVEKHHFHQVNVLLLERNQ
ncbi:MAG: glycosyltransferase family 39 protein [Saprospiraceae bacterium]|nr:glycosyltransferase family 39 protein [Saprospiraceae bacterium]